ncbi:MAG: acyl-CoA dehydrogenase family protein [Actinomycetales bacterium]|uniref:Acyl-CoA dehydrogenase family protein n=1 Tax=Candidatus Phosphoribacter hodrii TaxID=2953743 RepID=A0A935CET1_9MICO|nr:acyl-CoA dehydrogenase family protein [Candidatus Phosphoribacter hodrii]
MLPESVGGTGAGFLALAAVAEQLAWVYPLLTAAMNLQAATVPLTIANWGTPQQVQRSRACKPISGECLQANAMTEPDGGSDLLGAMRTRAVRDGDSHVINGANLWITNGNRRRRRPLVHGQDRPGALTVASAPSSCRPTRPGSRLGRVPCRGLGSFRADDLHLLHRRPRARLGAARAEGEGFHRRHERDGLRPPHCLGLGGRFRHQAVPRRRALPTPTRGVALGRKISSFRMVRSSWPT